MTGILLIDKPEGMTSFVAAARVRRMTGVKKTGHTGTLDPMATGVLPVLLGGATRFCELLPSHDKAYVASLKLGTVTDTLDITGEVLETREVNASRADFESALQSFSGTIEQVPPMYSAISQNGVRLYKLARQGIEAEIHTIEGSVEIAPAVGLSDAIFDIVSSGGTLVSNGLREVETVLRSEAALIACPSLDADKRSQTEQLVFRFRSIRESRDMKYVLMNLPVEKVAEATALLPGMRSPTILPLAQEGWCSLHAVIGKAQLWERIERLKAIGAEGILVLALENMIR